MGTKPTMHCMFPHWGGRRRGSYSIALIQILCILLYLPIVSIIATYLCRLSPLIAQGSWESGAILAMDVGIFPPPPQPFSFENRRIIYVMILAIMYAMTSAESICIQYCFPSSSIIEQQLHHVRMWKTLREH